MSVESTEIHGARVLSKRFFIGAAVLVTVALVLYLFVTEPRPAYFSGFSSSEELDSQIDSASQLAAQNLLEEAESLKLKGKLVEARDAFTRLMTQYDSIPWPEAMDGIMEMDAKTYGGLARLRLDYVNLEIAKGRSKSFSDAKALFRAVRDAFQQNDLSAIESLAWVEFSMGPCSSEFEVVTPDKLAAFLPSILLEKKPQQLTVLHEDVKEGVMLLSGFSPTPYAKIIIDRMERDQDSVWIWSALVTCGFKEF